MPDATRILVIEDDGPTRELVAEVLSQDGYALALESTAAGGLARASAERPDLILVGIGLTDLDGFALAERIRGAGIRSTLVALSAHTGPDDLRRGRAAGFDEYLFKPIKASALRSEIARLAAAPGTAAPTGLPAPLPPAKPRPRGVLGGLVVVAMGIPFILQPLGVPGAASYLFVAMGAAFLISYLRGHQYVYLIPMATLTSFGVALLLPTWIALRPEAVAPTFVGVIALGFLVAFGLAPERRWPLIPGAVLGAVAAARLITGWTPIPAPLEPFLVPIVLVGVGLYLLIEPQAS